MALRTPTTNDGGQGIIRVLNVSACATGDTVSYKGAVRAWIPVNRTSADAISATYNATTQLFTITVANTPDVSILVIS